MKRKINRLHTADARLLRDMVLSMHDQIREIENALGQVQHILNLDRDMLLEDAGIDSEILEVSNA